MGIFSYSLSFVCVCFLFGIISLINVERLSSEPGLTCDLTVPSIKDFRKEDLETL